MTSVVSEIITFPVPVKMERNVVLKRFSCSIDSKCVLCAFLVLVAMRQCGSQYSNMETVSGSGFLSAEVVESSDVEDNSSVADSTSATWNLASPTTLPRKRPAVASKSITPKFYQSPDPNTNTENYVGQITGVVPALAELDNRPTRFVYDRLDGRGMKIIVYLIAEGLVCLLTVIVNAMVMLMFLHQRRNHVKNVYLMNQNLADLTVGGVVPPLSVCVNVYRKPNHFHGCIVTMGVINMLTTASIFSLCSMSFDRLATVRYRNIARFHSEQFQKTVVCCIWMLASIYGIVVPMMWKPPEREFIHGCGYRNVQLVEYNVYLQTCAVFLPVLLFMVFVHVLILQTLRASAERMNTYRRSSRATLYRIKAWEDERKILTSLVLLLSVMFLTHAPLSVLNTVELVDTDILSTDTLNNFHYVAIVMSHLCSFLNPFVYCFSNTDLRRYFIFVMSRKLRTRGILTEQDITAADARKMSTRTLDFVPRKSSSYSLCIAASFRSLGSPMSLPNMYGRGTCPSSSTIASIGSQTPTLSLESSQSPISESPKPCPPRSQEILDTVKRKMSPTSRQNMAAVTRKISALSVISLGAVVTVARKLSPPYDRFHRSSVGAKAEVVSPGHVEGGVEQSLEDSSVDDNLEGRYALNSSSLNESQAVVVIKSTYGSSSVDYVDPCKQQEESRSL